MKKRIMPILGILISFLLLFIIVGEMNDNLVISFGIIGVLLLFIFYMCLILLNKETNFKKVWKFIDKNKTIIFYIIVTLTSLFIRTQLLEIESADYRTSLTSWYNRFKEYGGLPGLSENIGNYNFPYRVILALITYLPISGLYAIKAVSIIFDYVLAISAAIIVYKLFKNNIDVKKYVFITYSLVIMLPTVVLNSAAWAQCDSIFASFSILSLMYLIEEKYVKSFILLGISFAFKLQFIFILPAYILVYILQRKFSIFNFLIIPITNLVICLPTLMFGGKLTDCIAVYFNQTQIYKKYISLNFPGVYNFFFKGTNLVNNPNKYIPVVGVIFTLFIFMIVVYILLNKRYILTKENIISLSLWSILVATFFLPRMHDRYMYVADVLSIIYFMIHKKQWYVPLGVVGCSLYCYSSYLFSNMSIPIAYVSILNFAIICFLTKDIFTRQLQQNNN